MRICVLIDAWEPIWGGGQTHVWELSKLLVLKYKHKIDIYTRSIISDDHKVFDKNNYFFNRELHIIRIGPVTKFTNLYGRIIWIFTVVYNIYINNKHKKYDLIHSHAYISGLPGKIIGWLLKIPVIYTVHGSNNLDLNKKSFITFLERFLLTKIHYDKEISVSQTFLKYKNVNFPIAIIPNGSDINRFNEVRKTKKHSRLINLLFVGRLESVKGIDILIQAFAKASKINDLLRLSIVGYGNQLTAYQKLTKDLKIENKIQFIGKISNQEIISFYKSADIFILPSLSEGQSISLLEAWSAKLPVIATNVGDNPIYIKHKVNGYLIKPNNIFVLQKAILEAIKDKRLKIYGKNGYQLIKNNFSWDKSANKINQIYNQAKNL